MNDKKTVLKKLLHFRNERDWKQFHTPQNIAKSIVLEAAEVLEIFQWEVSGKLTAKKKSHLAQELADVYNWVLLLSHDLEIDIDVEALRKIALNDKLYPIEKVKGKSKKYTEL